MAVQVGQGKRSVNHDGAFFESGVKACHSRQGSQKKIPRLKSNGVLLVGDLPRRDGNRFSQGLRRGRVPSACG
ncbi:hypothetical protein C3B79_0732 [Aeromonas hydrophila]|nr:hypothetical protein C3B79_0732 [Aeromonas hydrophila]